MLAFISSIQCEELLFVILYYVKFGLFICPYEATDIEICCDWLQVILVFLLRRLIYIINLFIFVVCVGRYYSSCLVKRTLQFGCRWLLNSRSCMMNWRISLFEMFVLIKRLHWKVNQGQQWWCSFVRQPTIISYIDVAMTMLAFTKWQN